MVYPVGVPGTFLRGDADSDGRVALTDAVKVLQYLFRGGGQPECLDAADFRLPGQRSRGSIRRKTLSAASSSKRVAGLEKSPGTFPGSSAILELGVETDRAETAYDSRTWHAGAQ